MEGFQGLLQAVGGMPCPEKGFCIGLKPQHLRYLSTYGFLPNQVTINLDSETFQLCVLGQVTISRNLNQLICNMEISLSSVAGLSREAMCSHS